ncbi:MAG: twin-arginine translocation signal domain-containing protein [bacterium]
MSFDRRDFLKLAGMAGLAVVTPRGAARAQTADDRFWVFVHANGGWDPTSLCDPKGRRDEEEEDPVNHYFTDDIGTAGNIRYAPVAYNAEFFQKHYRRTLVLNGVDSQTNNHDAGTRPHLERQALGGYPPSPPSSQASRRARPRWPSSPTAATTTPAASSRRRGQVSTRAQPHRLRIGWTRTTRTATATTAPRPGTASRPPSPPGRATSPRRCACRVQHAINQLFTARVGRSRVRRLSEYLPERFDDDGLKRQAQVAVAAFRAGIGKAANLSIGGFDTHGNHDDSHFRGSPTSCRASTSCGTRPSGTASRTSSSSWWAATSGGRPATTAATARTTGRSRA